MRGHAKVRARDDGLSFSVAAQSGYVLIMVMLFAFIVATTAFLIQHDSAINTDMAAGEMQRDELRYVTEAGLKHAEWIANQGTCNAYDLPSTSFGTSTYSAAFTPTSGSPLKISVTGTTASGGVRTVSRSEVTAYSAAKTIVIQPDSATGKDTWVYDWKSTWGYGTNAKLSVISGTDIAHSFLQFDLSSIPPEARIVSAVLELYQQANGSDGGDVGVHRVTSPWIEGTVNQGIGVPNWNERDGGNTWATPGGDFETTAIDSTSIPSGTVGWYQWDVTALVDGWVSGTWPNEGLAMAPGQAGSVWLEFSSSDNIVAAQHPKLTITYACECGVGGSSDVLITQPDATAGKDTRIYDAQASVNYGTGIALVVENTPGKIQRSLLEFDLSSIPAGAIIDSATLQVTATVVAVSGTVGIHEVTTPWEESQVTWVEAVTGVNWGSSGSDFDPIAADSQFVSSLTSYDFDVTAIVARWVQNGAPNNGFLLKDQSNVEVSIASSDQPTQADHPQLTVNYTCACGSCPAGGGGGAKNLLFVVASDASLTAEEEAHKSLLESWDYVVTPIDEDATQTEFDTAVAASNIVFLTNDVTSSRVNTKLVDAPIGIVTSEDNLSDEFGLSSGIGWESGSVIEVNDNTHYITSPFPAGILTIFNSSDSLAYLTGTLAPDLAKLASSNSGFGVVALDQGDTMHGGGTTAGRRVQLPWGGGGFSLSNLNPDGQNILQRALEWGNGAVNPGQKIVMVVGDPLALTPEQADKKALMEGWGHQVDLLAASADQSLFDDAATLADLVYVPELGTSAMGDLGSKADDLAIGVITEESRRAIKMGSFMLNPFVDSTSMNVVDNSHYITETLPLGNLALSTSTQSMWKLGGTLAPDLQILGELSGATPGLAVVESGDLVNDGLPAPGRRVKLPWGAYDFDVNLLTPEALTIMQRAIKWGAAGAIGGGGPGGGGGTPANFGYETIFASSQNGVRRKQIATQVVLPENGTISSITAYVGGRARPVRFALYSDNGVEPDHLLTESQTSSTGSSMAWLTLDVPETLLTAGTYWLAFSFDDSSQRYVFETGGHASYEGNRATQNGFTSPWSSDQALPRKISIYGTYMPE